MTSIVIDTSVAVWILASPKRSTHLSRILSQYTIYTSPYILDEVERILVTRFSKTRQQSKTITRLYSRNAQMISNPPATIINVRDKSDQPIVDLCVAAKAVYLVTNDKDLHQVKIKGCSVVRLEELTTLA